MFAFALLQAMFAVVIMSSLAGSPILENNIRADFLFAHNFLHADLFVEQTMEKIRWS